MAKLNADKLKNLARGLKGEGGAAGAVKKLGDATKQSEARKKQSTGDEKASGRKN